MKVCRSARLQWLNILGYGELGRRVSLRGRAGRPAVPRDTPLCRHLLSIWQDWAGPHLMLDAMTHLPVPGPAGQ